MDRRLATAERADVESEAPPGQPVPDAYRLPATEVATRLAVDPDTGLGTAEAARRTALHGPNQLAEPARRPEWLKFLDQFRNWLIGILLIAAVVAGAIGDIKDAVVITVILQINAVRGYLQERRAERSLEALRRMLVPTARVRRDGETRLVEAVTLVPGDVVLLEAGDRIPADGRLTVAESVEVAEVAEAALAVLAVKAGVDADTVRAERPRSGEVPFDAATKYMATFHTEPDGRTRVHVKGALDVLLDHCTDVLTEDGVRGLDDARRSEILAVASRLGSTGLRVLVAAPAVVDAPPPAPAPDGPTALPGLTLMSVAGIADPPRPQARDAVALCRTAGVAVKMITGDHADTAAAIARELDIVGEVVTGAELDRMTADQLAERIDGVGVFARVAPAHKVTIVRALTKRGHIVAMTGDGVNDAAALRAAHICGYSSQPR